MAAEAHGLGFPFGVTPVGRVSATGGDEELRGKIIQVLFTAPGERVHRPQFGCGLFNLVFEPNDAVLGAAVEFSIGQALVRWLGDEIVVNGIRVARADEMVSIEVAYTKRSDRTTQAVRIRFR